MLTVQLGQVLSKVHVIRFVTSGGDDDDDDDDDDDVI